MRGDLPFHATQHEAVCRATPHTRGDVTFSHSARNVLVRSAPRTWGCSALGKPKCFRARVYPTHAGMCLFTVPRMHVVTSLPHMRGDAPQVRLFPSLDWRSAPRTWGHTCGETVLKFNDWAYPAYAGMFPCLRIRSSGRKRLPHVCGDAPCPRTMMRRWPVAALPA